MTDKELLLRIRVESDEVKKLNSELDMLKNRISILDGVLKENGKLTEKQAQYYAESGAKARELLEQKKKLIETEKQHAKEMSLVEGSMAKLRFETSNMIKEANNLNTSTKEGSARFDFLKTKIEGNKEKIRDFDRGMSGSSTLVGEYGKGIIGAFTQIGVAIGGAVAIVKSFQAVVESADSSQDSWNEVFKSGSNAVDVFMKSLATGDFTNFIGNLISAIKYGEEYAQIMDELADKTREFSIEEAKQQNEITKLRIVQKDATKSTEDQIAAGEKIMVIEKQLAETRTNLASKALQAEAENLSRLTGLKSEDVIKTVEQFSSVEELLEVGKKYSEELASIERMSGTVANFNSVEALKKLAETYGENGAAAAKYYDGTAKLSEKEREKIKELLVAKYEAENSVNQHTLKVQTELNKDKDRLRKDQEDKEEKALEDAKKRAKAKADFELSQLQYYYDMWLKLADSNNKKDEKNMSDAENILQEEVDANQEAANEEVAIADKKYDKMAKQNKKATDDAVKEERRKARMREDIIRAAEQTIGSLFGYQAARYDAAMQKEIDAAGDNASKREEIEKKYAKKKQRMAIMESIINTALAVTSAAGSGWPMPAPVLMIAAGAAGAIQTAAIAAQQFAAGGKIMFNAGARLSRPTAKGDDQIIVAKTGEVVLNERQQAALGGPRAFRRIGVPGFESYPAFADGGIIGANYNYAGGFSGIDYDVLADKISRSVNDKKVIMVMSDLNSSVNDYNRVQTRQKI
jgi:hypothetical protein